MKDDAALKQQMLLSAVLELQADCESAKEHRSAVTVTMDTVPPGSRRPRRFDTIEGRREKQFFLWLGSCWCQNTGLAHA